MRVEVRREPPSRAVLEVELPPEAVTQGVDRALTRLNRRVEIPGFRRGKAPKAMLERHVGKDAVYEEAVKQLVPDAYAKAIDQAGVSPIAQPQIKLDPLEEGKPLRFVATVDLMPEVRLGEYRTIRLPFQEPVVSDADVDAAVEDLRVRHAHLVSMGERAAEPGDYVLIRTVEISGSHDRFLPGKEYLIEIGGGAYPQEVETALKGARAGAHLVAALRPGSGPAEQSPPSAGATVSLDVVDVKRKELPELTDDFARMTASVPSVQALRDTLRQRMHGEVVSRAQQEYEQQVIDALLNGAVIELPDSLIEHEVAHLIADLTETLQRRGMTLARYLEGTEKTEASLREELRPRAARRLQTQLAMEEVARGQGLQPSQEEIDREVENVARGLQDDTARVREWLERNGRQDALTDTLRRRKALAYLVSVARGDPFDSAQGHPEQSRTGDPFDSPQDHPEQRRRGEPA